jgi:GAF domain-containing protein
VAGTADDPSTLRTREALDGLARLLLTEENTQSVLQRVVDLVVRVMPAGAEASMTLVRDQRPTTAASTGPRALQLDETQYEQGHGPCLDAALHGQVMVIDDGRTEARWPEYLPAFLRYGALSLLAVPVPTVQSAAGLNVYAPEAGAFTDRHRDAAAQLAAYAAVALSNVDALQDARGQAEHLRVAMASRAAIEQAKGILIERHRLTPDQAFRLLAEASMRTNRKVRDLAEDLVRTGELPAAFPPGTAGAPARARAPGTAGAPGPGGAAGLAGAPSRGTPRPSLPRSRPHRAQSPPDGNR